MTSILEISKPEELNTGGVKEINMSLLEDIALMPYPVNNVVTRGIRMKPGMLFHKFYFTPDSCKFSQSFVNTVHGKEFTVRVSFTYRNASPEIIYEFEKMKRMEFIVIPKDNNDKYRILGSTDSPAVFSYEYNSGPAFTNADQCLCSFTAKSKRPALYYGSTFGQVVFNAGFNFGFLRTR